MARVTLLSAYVSSCNAASFPCAPRHPRHLSRRAATVHHLRTSPVNVSQASSLPTQSSSIPASTSKSGNEAFSVTRREALLFAFAATGEILGPGAYSVVADEERRPTFYELDGSGGVKALDIREGTGATPQIGDKVAIHYYARLAAKQGWRFDSSYEHKDKTGTPEPYVFVIGDNTVIAGLDSAVRTMKEGGIRRVVIPPSQGYQDTTQGPIPPNFSDRQRLYTTIFNPTRLANGEGSTLGILVFDIELLRIRS